MAGLIPKGFIDDLLRRTDIVEVVGDCISLKKSGRNYSACCPFHEEKTPSFSVSAEKQFYHCFGCGESGNAIGFVMRHHNVDFPEAVETLARRAGVDVPREGGNDQQQARRSDLSPLYDAVSGTSTFYKTALHSHPDRQQAVSYLASKGVGKEVAVEYMLGYAPADGRSLSRVQGSASQVGKPLMVAGLIASNPETHSIEDFYRGHVLFPVRDTRGRAIGFVGQVPRLGKPVQRSSPQSPVFNPDRDLYGLYEARQHTRATADIIIVDQCLDVVVLAQHGIRNTASTPGVAPTVEHVRNALRVAPGITFCFEDSASGHKAAWTALESCMPHMKDGVGVRLLFLPQGKTLGDVAQAKGAPAVRELIERESMPLSECFFKQLSQGLDMTSLEAKARIATQAVPMIESIPEGYLRKLMTSHLHQLTGAHIRPPAQSQPVPVPALELESMDPASERQAHAKLLASIINRVDDWAAVAGGYDVGENAPARRSPGLD